MPIKLLIMEHTVIPNSSVPLAVLQPYQQRSKSSLFFDEQRGEHAVWYSSEKNGSFTFCLCVTTLLFLPDFLYLLLDERRSSVTAIPGCTKRWLKKMPHVLVFYGDPICSCRQTVMVCSCRVRWQQAPLIAKEMDCGAVWPCGRWAEVGMMCAGMLFDNVSCCVLLLSMVCHILPSSMLFSSSPGCRRFPAFNPFLFD